MSATARGKAAKKNQKRAEKRAKERAQKLKEDGVIDRLVHETEDPVEKLKAQLQEAKDNKDHKLAAKLRKDLWIMQDQMAGCLPYELNTKAVNKASVNWKESTGVTAYDHNSNDPILVTLSPVR